MIFIMIQDTLYVAGRLTANENQTNSRQENRSKLFFTARIITKYSLERFLSICGEKMSKGFLKFYKLIIKPDTRSDHCLKSYKRA